MLEQKLIRYANNKIKQNLYDYVPWSFTPKIVAVPRHYFGHIATCNQEDCDRTGNSKHYFIQAEATGNPFMCLHCYEKKLSQKIVKCNGCKGSIYLADAVYQENDEHVCKWCARVNKMNRDYKQCARCHTYHDPKSMDKKTKKVCASCIESKLRWCSKCNGYHYTKTKDRNIALQEHVDRMGIVRPVCGKRAKKVKAKPLANIINLEFQRIRNKIKKAPAC